MLWSTRKWRLVTRLLGLPRFAGESDLALLAKFATHSLGSLNCRIGGIVEYPVINPPDPEQIDPQPRPGYA